MVTSQGPRTRFQAQHCQAKQAHIQAATTRRQGTGAADAFADLTTPESASRHTLVLARGLKTTSETSRSQSHRRKRRRANSGEARLANGWRLEELLLLQSLSSTNGGVHTLPLQAALFERSRRTRFPTARQGEGEHNPRLFFFFFSSPDAADVLEHDLPRLRRPRRHRFFLQGASYPPPPWSTLSLYPGSRCGLRALARMHALPV